MGEKSFLLFCLWDCETLLLKQGPSWTRTTQPRSGTHRRSLPLLAVCFHAYRIWSIIPRHTTTRKPIPRERLGDKRMLMPRDTLGRSYEGRDMEHQIAPKATFEMHGWAACEVVFVTCMPMAEIMCQSQQGGKIGMWDAGVIKKMGGKEFWKNKREKKANFCYCRLLQTLIYGRQKERNQLIG